jgi:hypothetical protein
LQSYIAQVRSQQGRARIWKLPHYLKNIVQNGGAPN